MIDETANSMTRKYNILQENWQISKLNKSTQKG